jgi:L-threonylcarbamoyladenylate synthase
MLTLLVSPENPEAALIARAADELRGRGIVAYPTDTIYGLAVDPANDLVVDRLFEVKGRPAGVPIPLIAASLEQAQDVAVFTDADLRLARAFWPGPLTIVLAPRRPLAQRILGGGMTIALRVPANPIACALASAFRACVTSTSANRSGQPASTSAAEVVSALGDTIDLVLDGGPSAAGAASTIVEIGREGPRLVRAGAIAWDRVLESLE